MVSRRRGTAIVVGWLLIVALLGPSTTPAAAAIRPAGEAWS